MGAIDIVLRALIGVLAVLILGVGIWTTIDSTHVKAINTQPNRNERSEASRTNDIAHVSDSSR